MRFKNRFDGLDGSIEETREKNLFFFIFIDRYRKRREEKKTLLVNMAATVRSINSERRIAKPIRIWVNYSTKLFLYDFQLRMSSNNVYIETVVNGLVFNAIRFTLRVQKRSLLSLIIDYAFLPFSRTYMKEQ